eukprot:6182047-Pleurochrysis_carterae.AAC.2
MASAPAAPAVDGTQISYIITIIFMTEPCVQRSPEFLHVMTWRSAYGMLYGVRQASHRPFNVKARKKPLFISRISHIY